MPVLRATLKPSGSSAVSVELPKAGLGFSPGDDLQWVGLGGPAALVIREGALEKGFFAGDLRSLSVAEVLGQIVSGIRTGRLEVAQGQSRRTVDFRDGQVVFAASSESHERLGTYLVQRRILTSRQLEQVLVTRKPGTKLGQALTQSGAISATRLYAAIAQLVVEIVLGLFELGDGHFLFEDGKTTSDAVKLPSRTRDLMLAGLRRAEEIARLRRLYPPELRMQAGPGATQASLQPLLARAASGATVAQLRESFSGGEFAFLSAVHEMVGAGALAEQKRVRPRAEGEQVAATPPSTLELYSALIRTICDALRGTGRDLSDLRRFFSEPGLGPEGAFEGVELDDSGSMNVEKVLENVSGSGAAVARAMAYEALDAFVSYALFSTKNVLPPELAELLELEFRRIQEGA